MPEKGKLKRGSRELSGFTPTNKIARQLRDIRAVRLASSREPRLVLAEQLGC
jgi:hypothetical protein